MSERRPRGALEAAVLSALWAADGGLSAAEVRDRVDPSLALTTVMTALSRLEEKQVVEHRRIGRVNVYSASRSEAEVIADRMTSELLHTADPGAALLHFVERLAPSEVDALQALLEDLDR